MQFVCWPAVTSVWRFYAGRKAVFLWAQLAWAYEKRSSSSAEQRWAQIERAAWPPRRKRRRPRCLVLFRSRSIPPEGVLFPACRQESLAQNNHEKKWEIGELTVASATRGNFLRTYATAGTPPQPPTGPLGVPGTPPRRLASGWTPEAPGRGRTPASTSTPASNARRRAKKGE